MNLKTKIWLPGTLLMAALFTGCKDETVIEPNDNTNTNNGLLEIASAQSDAGDWTVKLFASEQLFMGYNRLYLEVWDKTTNKRVEEAKLELNPMMDMGTMQHSAPFENPPELAESGKFPCAVVFQMPGEMGWQLNVEVQMPDGSRKGSVEIPLKVISPDVVRTHVIMPANGGNPVIVSLVEPQDPKVGLNRFEISIHRRASMMSFPADDSLTVEIEPEMPSMGHGSPNNVNPVISENGHYVGTVNFTMTGKWHVNLKIMEGADLVDDQSYFEINLK